MRRAVITWFGCGEMPIASGTWGSAGAVIPAVAWYAACRWGIGGESWTLWFHLGLLAAMLAASAAAVAWGPWAVNEFASHRNTRKPGDPGAFVLDEVAGQWLSLLALPIGDVRQAAIVGAVQFFLFRIADILKPPPGRRLEKLPHGWGILLDDLSSAIWANAAGQLLFRAVLDWK
ncbi:MAG: phosphatidylglycerophosphatase A [Phycisphaerae bacterium]|nr:phosphatidylglycerophosphatase A [Phycisphaerae bacterium]NUQ47658.1 phosphatidylglycerophosphatase A [Phycisphaerae bacterium]